MITVTEAHGIIQKHILTTPTEGVPLAQSVGRILRENIIADRDFPPFDRVTMDGIAIRYADYEKGQRTFKIMGVQAAGQPPAVLNNFAEGTCYEVMTGAIMPNFYDTIVRYEDLKIADGAATITAEHIDYQQNIHQKAADRRTGEVIVQAGERITAAEIATAATVGKNILLVSKRPRVAVISTGDELVDIDKQPQLHQIRRSNVYAIAALLQSVKIEPVLYHFNDDETMITEGLTRVFDTSDIVILSGAVSEGKFDFVPKALDTLGVEKLFHKVAQRPGKPFWFGVRRRDEQVTQVIFALPGNPVSTFLCTCRYVLPYLNTILGLNKTPKEWAVLTEKVIFKPDLTYFLQVKVRVTEGGVLEAQPVEGGGSGDLANLNDADGFLELPSDKTVFDVGEHYPFVRYRSFF